jgi:hypothetical protein
MYSIYDKTHYNPPPIVQKIATLELFWRLTDSPVFLPVQFIIH